MRNRYVLLKLLKIRQRHTAAEVPTPEKMMDSGKLNSHFARMLCGALPICSVLFLPNLWCLLLSVAPGLNVRERIRSKVTIL